MPEMVATGAIMALMAEQTSATAVTTGRDPTVLNMAASVVEDLMAVGLLHPAGAAKEATAPATLDAAATTVALAADGDKVAALTAGEDAAATVTVVTADQVRHGFS